MAEISKERVAEILREADNEISWTQLSDAELEDLTKIFSGSAFQNEADVIYFVKNLPKVLRATPAA